MSFFKCSFLHAENVLRCSPTCVKLVDFGLSRFFPPSDGSEPNNAPTTDPNSSKSFKSPILSSPKSLCSPRSSLKSSPKLTSPRKQSSDIYHLMTQCGSVHYCSPELLYADKGNPYDGIKSDIWSLGVLLYTLVCACLPFSGDSIPVLVKKITNGQFKFPKGVPLTPSVKSLIRSILKVDPAERPTIEEILQHEWFKHDRFGLQLSVGTLPHDKIMKAIELFGTVVKPAIDKALPPAPAPTQEPALALNAG